MPAEIRAAIEKAAHYNVPMRLRISRPAAGHRTVASALRRWLLLLLAALLLFVATAPPAWPDASDRRAEAQKTEAELAAIRAEIERIRNRMARDQVERDRLEKELREAELAVADARGRLERVREERAERTKRRAELAREKEQRQSELARERAALAGQLRAAYMIGREEPLKLLLNQKDPARVGRMFAYYGYFGRARAEQIDRIQAHVRRIEQLDQELQAEEKQLAALESEQRAELERLEQARSAREKVLARLESESRSRARTLERLKRQQAGLEKLLSELRRAMEQFPIDGKDAFAKVRGKLAWPVPGRITARFGEPRAGGVKWDGILIAAERGTPVRAIYDGRVVYADWLPGLGLLTIIDHGDGYLSLYGHNDQLYKAVGERVRAGDPVAAVGDSGGRSRPELYFEIRRNGRPVDPRPWFKFPAP